MTQDLRFELKESTDYVASKTDGTEFTFNSGASGTANASRVMSPGTVYVPDSDSYYYTFTAATVGTLGASNYLPEGSICPKGWRMPVITARYGATFLGLLQAYSATTTFAKAKVLPLEFRKNGRTVYSTGALQLYNASNESASSGGYWTAQAQDPSVYLIYVLSFAADATGAAGNNHAYYHTGLNIRCVAL